MSMNKLQYSVKIKAENEAYVTYERLTGERPGSAGRAAIDHVLCSSDTDEQDLSEIIDNAVRAARDADGEVV